MGRNGSKALESTLAWIVLFDPGYRDLASRGNGFGPRRWQLPEYRFAKMVDLNQEPQLTSMFTFLFTDIGPTRTPLFGQQYPKEMSTALADHDSILHQIIPTYDGEVVKSTGDGILAVFDKLLSAAQAAIALQKRLIQHTWGETGAPACPHGNSLRGGRAAAMWIITARQLIRPPGSCHLASGEQILLSDTSVTLLNDEAQEAFRFQELGKYRLKGLAGQTGGPTA